MLLALPAMLVASVLAARAAPPMPHLLFVDEQDIAAMDDRLEKRVQAPVKNDRVISPTEPWESWAVFAYNHVVAGTATRPHRMYYDCIEGSGVPPGGFDDLGGTLAHRRICLAESVDGKTWTKPKLGIFPWTDPSTNKTTTDNNILLEDSGNSVFQEPDGTWKMVCSTSAYASKDGLRWTRLPFTKTAEDDTKPTAYWDPALSKYVVSVRRDCSPSDCQWENGSVVHAKSTRFVGRCVTSNLSNWQQEIPAGASGCPVVFGPDDLDPERVDVYTNAWTPYPSIDEPVVQLFFPSFYHHFLSQAPFGFGNDGLLDIRLAISRDGKSVTYPTARNARAPWVPLGYNHCVSHIFTWSMRAGSLGHPLTSKLNC